MKTARKKPAAPLTRAKRKVAAAKAATPKTKREWGKVIRSAEAVLRLAGVRL